MITMKTKQMLNRKMIFGFYFKSDQVDLVGYGKSNKKKLEKYMQWNKCQRLSKYLLRFRIIDKKSVNSIMN